jgi:hypothetical protein
MFRCDQCGNLAQPGETCHRVVTETRDVVHPYRGRVHRLKNAGEPVYRDDPGGTGTQTVREAKLCTQCYNDRKSPEPSTK